MTEQFTRLHEKAKQLADDSRDLDAKLLDVLIEIDNKRAYLPLGFNSLFQYCVSYLRFSESQSYAFMSIARKSKAVPELKEAVEKKEITLSNARKLVSVITPENKSNWLDKGKTLTQKDLEKEVIKENPKAHVNERIRQVTETESELRVGLDSEMEIALKRVQALIGTSSSKEALKALLKDYLKHHDPIEKAKRAKTKTSEPQLGARPVGNSRAIPQAVLHEVHQRDNGKCQFKGRDGNRCHSSYWVQVHHLEPWAYGGKHELSNLITLCSKHHRYWHQTQVVRTLYGAASVQ